MATPRVLAGVDVGGTKIAAGLAGEDGSVIVSRHVRTAQEGGAGVVGQIVDLLERLLRDPDAPKESIAAIGVSVPAVVDRERGSVLWAPNVAGWQQEVEVARPIRESVGIPTSLHYDGHAWVTGEWWSGAARGTRDAALVAVGTGVGGGMILGGRLHTGRVGVAGALGWWVADWREAGSAKRGTTGQLEALASGPAIARAAEKDTAEEALEAAREGDGRAREALKQAAEALGAAVANLVSLVDPEIVVLAGGVIAGGADLLLPRVREIVRLEAQPQVARGVQIVTAQLGEDAAWLGAAKLAVRQLEGKEEGC